MSALELVAPEQVSDLVVLDDQCASVEQWAADCDSIAALKDAGNKLAAIGEYLQRTSVEGRARVAAAMRRLEVRIGELLGPAQNGGDRRSDQFHRDETEISGPIRTQFRAMAANPDAVEQVIAESSDEEPASRRKVMQAVKPSAAMDRLDQARRNNPPEPPSFRSRDAMEARVAKAREMAELGSTSRQIAAEIGIAAEGMAQFRRTHGIDVPADRVVGKSARFDHNRIVQTTVDLAASLSAGSDLYDLSAVNADLIDGWVSSLSDSIRFLTTLRNDLKKEQTQRD